MATIKDVAKLAGVSTATVSRFINESGYVSEEAHKKIEQSIKALDYYPNEIARSLFTSKSKIIGLIIPDISNPYFTEVARGAEEMANSQGYNLILINSEQTEAQKNSLQFINQYNLSGVLQASGTIIDDFVKAPVVYLDRAEAQVDYGIHLNNSRGGQLAAEAIIQGKPKNVIIVAGPAEVKVAAERLSGAISVLNANQLTYKVIHTESYGIEEAKALAADFFTRFPDVDSIIASNDIFALALINQANQHGISVPDQLQIVGFDNIPYSQLSVPSISTIEQFARKIGYEGAELLFRKILNKPITEKKIVIEPVLVERESLRKA